MAIGIIDYNMGNIGAFVRKFELMQTDYTICSTIEALEKVDKLILPGVGHFKNAMDNLKQKNFIPVLNKMVLEDKVPVLGICLGMQLMTNKSEEGEAEGLGWIDAETKKFNVSNPHQFKIPMIGWNTVKQQKSSKILNEIEDNSAFYFVHSYYVKCNKPEDVLTQSKYDLHYTSAFAKDNIFGMQFHPEKSLDTGFKIIQNFINL